MNATFDTGVVDGTQMDGCFENRGGAASGARFEHILEHCWVDSKELLYSRIESE